MAGVLSREELGVPDLPLRNGALPGVLSRELLVVEDGVLLGLAREGVLFTEGPGVALLELLGFTRAVLFTGVVVDRPGLLAATPTGELREPTFNPFTPDFWERTSIIKL